MTLPRHLRESRPSRESHFHSRSRQQMVFTPTVLNRHNSNDPQNLHSDEVEEPADASEHSYDEELISFETRRLLRRADALTRGGRQKERRGGSCDHRSDSSGKENRNYNETNSEVSTSNLLSSHRSAFDSVKSERKSDEKYVLVDRRECAVVRRSTSQSSNSTSRQYSKSSSAQTLTNSSKNKESERNEARPQMKSESVQVHLSEVQQSFPTARARVFRDEEIQVGERKTFHESNKSTQTVTEKRHAVRANVEKQQQEKKQPTSDDNVPQVATRTSRKSSKDENIKNNERTAVKVRSSSEDPLKRRHPAKNTNGAKRRAKSDERKETILDDHDEQECKVRSRRNHVAEKPWRSHMKNHVQHSEVNNTENCTDKKDHKELLEERPRPWRENMKIVSKENDEHENKEKQKSEEAVAEDAIRSEAIQKYIKKKREQHKRELRATMKSHEANKVGIEQKLRDLEERRRTALEANQKMQMQKVYGRQSSTCRLGAKSTHPTKLAKGTKKESFRERLGSHDIVPVKTSKIASSSRKEKPSNEFLKKPNNLEKAQREIAMTAKSNNSKNNFKNEESQAPPTNVCQATNEKTAGLASKVSSLLRRNEEDLAAISNANKNLLAADIDKTDATMAISTRDPFTVVETQNRLRGTKKQIESVDDPRKKAKHMAPNTSLLTGSAQEAESPHFDVASRGDVAVAENAPHSSQEARIEVPIDTNRSRTRDEKATTKTSSNKHLKDSAQVTGAQVKPPNVSEPQSKASITSRTNEAKALELRFAAELQQLEALQRAETHLSDIDRVNARHLVSFDPHQPESDGATLLGNRGSLKEAAMNELKELNARLEQLDVERKSGENDEFRVASQASLKELAMLVEEQSKRIQSLAMKSTQCTQTSPVCPQSTTQLRPKVLDARLRTMIASVDEEAQRVQTTIEKSEQSAQIVSQTISDAIKSLSVMEENFEKVKSDAETSEATCVLSSSSSVVASSLSSSITATDELSSLLSFKDDNDLKLHEVRLVTKTKNKLIMLSLDRHRLKSRAKEEKNEDRRSSLLKKMKALKDEEKQLTKELKQKLEEIRIERERRLLKASKTSDKSTECNEAKIGSGCVTKDDDGPKRSPSKKIHASTDGDKVDFAKSVVDSDESLTVSQSDSDIRLEALASELQSRMRTAARLRHRQISLSSKEVTRSQERMLRRQIEQYDRLIAESQNLLKTSYESKTLSSALAKPVIMTQEKEMSDDTSLSHASSRRRFSSDALFEHSSRIRLQRRASIDPESFIATRSRSQASKSVEEGIEDKSLSLERMSKNENAQSDETGSDNVVIEEGSLEKNDVVEEGLLHEEEMEEGPLDDEEIEEGPLDDEEIFEGSLDDLDNNTVQEISGDKINLSAFDGKKHESHKDQSMEATLTDDEIEEGPLNDSELLENSQNEELEVVPFGDRKPHPAHLSMEEQEVDLNGDKSISNEDDVEEGPFDDDDIEEGPLDEDDIDEGPLEEDDVEEGHFEDRDVDESTLHEDQIEGDVPDLSIHDEMVPTINENGVSELSFEKAEEKESDQSALAECNIEEGTLDDDQLNEGPLEDEEIENTSLSSSTRDKTLVDEDEMETGPLPDEEEDILADRAASEVEFFVGDKDESITEGKDISDQDPSQESPSKQIKGSLVDNQSETISSKNEKEDISFSHQESEKVKSSEGKITSDEKTAPEISDYTEDFSTTSNTPKVTSSLADKITDDLMHSLLADCLSKSAAILHPGNTDSTRMCSVEAEASRVMPVDNTMSFDAMAATKEWEEIKQKEMLIEQEMQRIEEATKAFVPPPPYTAPPSTPPPTVAKETIDSPDSSFFSSSFLIEFVSNMLEFMQTIETDSEKGRELLIEHMKADRSNVSIQCIELLVDLVLQIVQELLTKKGFLARRYAKEPQHLISAVTDEVLCLFGHRVKVIRPCLAIRCPHRPRDRVDDVLVRELHKEEDEWHDLKKDEMNAMNNVIEEVFEYLLDEAVEDIKFVFNRVDGK